MCACVTPEYIIFFPVLHPFPDRWIFSCLYSKCKDSNTYCSSALRSSRSESVTKGGCAGGICTAGWSFRSPPLPLLLGAPLATSAALRAPCCLSLVSSVSAIALSMASFTKHISALHSLPLSTCSPKLLSQLSSLILYSAKSCFPAIKVSGPLSVFQLPTVDPSGCLGLISRATRSSHKLFCMCHHYPRLRLLGGRRWRHLLAGREWASAWAGLNGCRQRAEGPVRHTHRCPG